MNQLAQTSLIPANDSGVYMISILLTKSTLGENM